MARKKTHEEFKNELKLITENIQILENYCGALTPILCRCRIDEHEWKSRPSDLLKGKGCPKCAGNIKKSHEDFVKEMYSVDNNIIIKSRYINAKSKIKCECKIDGHVWNSTANNLLRGYGCSLCNGGVKRLHSDFLKKIHVNNKNIEILGKYINGKTPILCKCKIDNHKWYATPSHLLCDTGCPQCNKGVRKSHEQFIKELSDINKDIEILGKYINTETKILCKCKIDGHIWEATPSNLLRYRGCPKCSRSQGERIIENYLNINNIKFNEQQAFEDLLGVGDRKLSYDFYLTTQNILIEYQGIQHEHPIEYFGGQEYFEIQQEHDRRKREYANIHNIKLLEIWYWDFDNIEDVLNKELTESNCEKSVAFSM